MLSELVQKCNILSIGVQRVQFDLTKKHHVHLNEVRKVAIVRCNACVAAYWRTHSTISMVYLHLINVTFL